MERGQIFVLMEREVGWCFSFLGPESDIGDDSPADEECQEEKKTKHICIKQLETAKETKEGRLDKSSVDYY